MVKHKLLLILMAALAIVLINVQATAQPPGILANTGGPLVDMYSVPDGYGLMFGIGSWGGYSMYGPYGIYDQYGLFGPWGLFGPSGPGYGSGLGFNGFGMHDPLELVKLHKQGVV